MGWISENYQPILVRLPVSFQVLPMRGELIVVILPFIHSGFSQPFGVLIVRSKNKFTPSIHLVILGFLDYWFPLHWNLYSDCLLSARARRMLWPTWAHCSSASLYHSCIASPSQLRASHIRYTYVGYRVRCAGRTGSY